MKFWRSLYYHWEQVYGLSSNRDADSAGQNCANGARPETDWADELMATPSQQHQTAPQRSNVNRATVDSALVIIRGAGDLATGVALRLYRMGFPVVMTEIGEPLAVRRSVALAEAIFAGQTSVEGVVGQRMTLAEVVRRRAEQETAPASPRNIPVIVDPEGVSLVQLRPTIVVDGIMAKRNTGTRMSDAPIVVGLGPGFWAGRDCHAVIETNRGHNLGRVIWHGSAEADTGQPGPVSGVAAGKNQLVPTRVLRAPCQGRVMDSLAIGSQVTAGMRIADVEDEQGRRESITAPFDGVLRGLVHTSVPVTMGMKIGDLDPRIEAVYCQTVSDKALAIGGGVAEAIFMLLHQQQE